MTANKRADKFSTVCACLNKKVENSSKNGKFYLAAFTRIIILR